MFNLSADCKQTEDMITGEAWRAQLIAKINADAIALKHILHMEFLVKTKDLRIPLHLKAIWNSSIRRMSREAGRSSMGLPLIAMNMQEKWIPIEARTAGTNYLKAPSDTIGLDDGLVIFKDRGLLWVDQPKFTCYKLIPISILPQNRFSRSQTKGNTNRINFNPEGYDDLIPWWGRPGLIFDEPSIVEAMLQAIDRFWKHWKE